MKYNLLILLLFTFSYNSKAQKIEITSIESEKLGIKNRDSFKKTSIKDAVTLRNNQNTFQIHFKSSAKNPIFAYKLQGFESVELQTNNDYAYYTNINEGNYIFYVRDLNNPQIKPSQLRIIVESPFWLQWWFAPLIFIFTMIIISVVIYLIFLYRFSQKLHLQKVRNDIASDLHDDVGATLSSISFFGEMMRSKVLKNAPAEEILPLLDKVISTSKETIETMRGVVWTINPNNDNAIDFFQKLRTFGNEMLATKNIKFQFETSGFEDQKLPLDVQRNLFLFYKECINNIAKHSKATNVGCEISVFENRNVSFTIKDNGLGFDPNDLHEGHGLKSLRKRADELEGKLEITSAEGKGTGTKLEFPLP